MKKLVDDARLIFKCCSLYYLDGLGQKEICNLLGISRPTVSRMLSLGKETGIVRIEIQNPDNVLYGQMERELEKALGLKEAIIVPGGLGPESTSHSDAELGRAALKYLARNIHEEDYIGISMGRILQNIVRSDYQIDEQVPCTFVPILGGFGESNPNLHSNYLAQEFAERFGGDYVQLLAPALVSNRSVMKYFMEEKPIYKVSRLFKKLAMVIMGIGIPNTEHSTVLHSGYVDKEILESFVQRGAVGDISLRYFDINGQAEPFQEFNQRVVGMALEELSTVPCRVGIASGKYKVKAVLGATRGKYINVLITDADCAQGLLEAVAPKDKD